MLRHIRQKEHGFTALHALATFIVVLVLAAVAFFTDGESTPAQEPTKASMINDTAKCITDPEPCTLPPSIMAVRYYTGDFDLSTWDFSGYLLVLKQRGTEISRLCYHPIDLVTLVGCPPGWTKAWTDEVSSLMGQPLGETSYS